MSPTPCDNFMERADDPNTGGRKICHICLLPKSLHQTPSGPPTDADYRKDDSDMDQLSDKWR